MRTPRRRQPGLSKPLEDVSRDWIVAVDTRAGTGGEYPVYSGLVYWIVGVDTRAGTGGEYPVCGGDSRISCSSRQQKCKNSEMIFQVRLLSILFFH